MAERRNQQVMEIALAAAFGVGTFAAIRRYNRQFEERAKIIRGQITGMVATHINYDELSQRPADLAAFCKRIPGEWRVSSVLADVMAEPKSQWVDIYRVAQSIADPHSESPHQQFRPAEYDQLTGLFLYREHVVTNRDSRFFSDIVQMGKVTNWLIGKDHLPEQLQQAWNT